MPPPTVTFTDVAGAADTTGAAVVVDVIRAFTTAAWAMHLGAEQITLVAGLDEALAIKAAEPGTLAFCDGRPKEGFDLFNSPVQLQRLDVAGRRIVHRTTNGTQGVVAARRASPLLCASFVVAAATARRLRESAVDHVTFVITGTDEDLACAEHIAALVRGEKPPSDALDRARRSAAAADIDSAPSRGYTGVDPGDVDACLDLDRFDLVLEVHTIDDRLVLLPEAPIP
ncbi:MAG: 2-phosphosulfolactate phosphatase [Acidimicrobiia bacterium]|nr:2-phosphosulfolactate phosphatase [Acidimicrobiia bacterium]